MTQKTQKAGATLSALSSKPPRKRVHLKCIHCGKRIHTALLAGRICWYHEGTPVEKRSMHAICKAAAEAGVLHPDNKILPANPTHICSSCGVGVRVISPKETGFSVSNHGSQVHNTNFFACHADFVHILNERNIIPNPFYKKGA